MELRKIDLGSHNMTRAVVLEGLKVGERVVLNPDHFRTKFKLTKPKGLAQK